MLARRSLQIGGASLEKRRFLETLGYVCFIWKRFILTFSHIIVVAVQLYMHMHVSNCFIISDIQTWWFYSSNIFFSIAPHLQYTDWFVLFFFYAYVVTRVERWPCKIWTLFVFNGMWTMLFQEKPTKYMWTIPYHRLILFLDMFL